MDETRKAPAVALPLDDRPEVHQAGSRSGESAPLALEQDKRIREGDLPEERFDDNRMEDLPEQLHEEPD